MDKNAVCELREIRPLIFYILPCQLEVNSDKRHDEFRFEEWKLETNRNQLWSGSKFQQLRYFHSDNVDSCLSETITNSHEKYIAPGILVIRESTVVWVTEFCIRTKNFPIADLTGQWKCGISEGKGESSWLPFWLSFPTLKVF